MLEAFKLFVQTASFFLFILLLVLVLVGFSRLFKINRKFNRLKRRYDALLRGSGELNLEEILLEHGKEIDKNSKDIATLTQEHKAMNSKVNFSIQKVGFVKYNAFPDLTNSLSYTLVMLDSYNNGIMITSIFGREQSTSFTKEVKDGRLAVQISDEEKEALNKALNN